MVNASEIRRARTEFSLLINALGATHLPIHKVVSAIKWAVEQGMGYLRAFLRDERGATAIEYAMIAGMVSIMVLASARSIGDAIQNAFFGPVSSALE